MLTVQICLQPEDVEMILMPYTFSQGFNQDIKAREGLDLGPFHVVILPFSPSIVIVLSHSVTHSFYEFSLC